MRTDESPAQPGGLQQAGRQGEAGTFPPGNSAREEKTEKMAKNGLGIKRQPANSGDSTNTAGLWSGILWQAPAAIQWPILASYSQ